MKILNFKISDFLKKEKKEKKKNGRMSDKKI